MVGYPKEAAKYFYYTKQYVKGNDKILKTELVKKYVPVKSRAKRRAPVKRAP